jgi:ribosomal protein S12 methylthiotransferase
MVKRTRRAEETAGKRTSDRAPAGDPRAGRAGEPAADPVRVNLVSLGCAKNLVDSEMILGSAGAAGLAITASPQDADVIVINTCGFIGPAREESMGAILEACALKESSPAPKKVVVTGCMAQRYGEEIRRRAPLVDAIIGLGQYGGIAGLIRDLAGDVAVPRLLVADPNTACNAETGRLRLTPPHYAYLRISEGCDNPCTFCAIPGMRGRFRSKPLEEIEVETRELVASGAEEIVLISQDTTSYGVDLDGRQQLPRLLERVAAVEGVRWVRVLYVYPSSFSDEMIEAVARTPKVLKYIDIPIQHIDDRMLRRMGRKSSEAYTRDLLARMRERIPGLYLRTTFIVGFPGEGEEEFRRLVSFVEEFRFERLGVFTYSREEGTPAARMGDDVSEAERLRRREELMLAQQEVAFDHNRRRVGEVCEAVVDGREGGRLFARSHGEAPEIDPRIFLSRAARDIEIGDFLNLEITGTRAYDLIARPALHRGL